MYQPRQLRVPSLSLPELWGLTERKKQERGLGARAAAVQMFPAPGGRRKVLFV